MEFSEKDGLYLVSSPESPSAYSHHRVTAFSDGVFAIAITVLVFNLKLPSALHQVTSHSLAQTLFQMWPNLLSYFISFTVIGLYWVAHNRIFQYVSRIDRNLMWLNIFLLMSVSFIPFPTSVIGSYANLSSAVVLYAGNLATTGYLQSFAWWYASKKNLLREGTSEHVIRFTFWRSLISPTLFLVSIACAFINVDYVKWVWLSMLIPALLLRKKETRSPKQNLLG